MIRKVTYINVWEINARKQPALSDAQIMFLATRGNWLINAELKQAPIDREWGNGDSRTFSGQGVADLDQIQRRMDQFPWGRFSVDVGGPDSNGVYIYIGTNDIIRLRETYIAMWGTVNRPQYWANDNQVIEVNGTETTAWP